MGGVSEQNPYRLVSMSEHVAWVVVHYERGCWRCRLRVRFRWPRPYRHFNCGPARGFPGVARLEDLL